VDPSSAHEEIVRRASNGRLSLGEVEWGLTGLDGGLPA
jgi:hypothetical protein